MSRTEPDILEEQMVKVRVAGVDRCGQQQTGEEVKELEGANSLGLIGL